MAVPTSLAVADTLLLAGCLGASIWLLREMKETAQSLDEVSSRLQGMREQVDRLEARVAEVLTRVDSRAAADADSSAAPHAPKPQSTTRRKAAKPKASSAGGPDTSETAGMKPRAQRAARPRKDTARE